MHPLLLDQSARRKATRGGADVARGVWEVVRWWLAAAGVVTAVALVALLARDADAGSAIAYRVDRSKPYGKVWGSTRPPGLPASARLASEEGAAYPLIEQHALRVSGGDEVFARALHALADKESTATFARPANEFCAASSCEDRVTAWGIWQWNDGAWDRLRERHDYAPSWRPKAAPDRPWQATPEQELRWPIEFYWSVYDNARRRGAGRRDAARAIFMFHSGPTRLRRFLDTAGSYGWADAWAYLGEDLSPEWVAWYREKRRSVDRLLAEVGVY